MKVEKGFVILQRPQGATISTAYALCSDTSGYSSEEAALKQAAVYARQYGSMEYFIAKIQVVSRSKPTPVEVEEVRL